MTATDTTTSIELTAAPEAPTTAVSLTATAAVKVRALLDQEHGVPVTFAYISDQPVAIHCSAASQPSW